MAALLKIVYHYSYTFWLVVVRQLDAGEGAWARTLGPGADARIRRRPGQDAISRAFSSRPILDWTRRIASGASLASVFPDLMRSPIRNCHFQTPGGSDLVSVYSTPL
jgi:hypothetical protein